MSYPLLFTFGVAAGMLWLIAVETEPAHSPRQRLANDPVIAGVVMLAAGLFTARLTFILLHSSYYFAHPLEILTLWQGGLSGIGGFAGALVGLGIYTRVKGESFAAYADAIAIPGAIIASSCWLGCWLDGCAYGIPIENQFPLLTGFDMYNSETLRWPTQAAGAIFSLLSIGVLITLKDRLPPGILGMLSFSLIALGVFVVSFFRSDPSLLVVGFRLDTLAALWLALLGIGGILIVTRNK
ncbi:MAG: prolipoprotein diacylglyceryl transferase family protein [Chloroflexota bacterium]|nr:prolipoprotein diacylglyceryl transferase family protein [Chloroflexota bacterium]